MKVNEIFHSLQGEGPFMGRHATFLRLAGCNLHCPDCDSSYSWEEGDEENCYDVLARLREHEPVQRYLVDGHVNRHYVVVTGGEPLLQSKEIGLMILASGKTWIWGVETNGTIFDLTEVFDSHDIHFIVSPKLSSMHSEGLNRFDKQWAEACKHTIDKVYFKFVIDNMFDLTEMDDFLNKHRIPRYKVWIMPKCTTAEEHLDKWKWVFEMALRYGVNASPRLHVLAYNNERGV